MEEQKIQFSIQKVVFPRLDFTFLKAPKEDRFQQAFRVNALIVSDTALKVLFGIKLTSEEQIEGTPVANAVVEAIADFQVSSPLGKVQKVSDIPLFANMLAVIFPFLREKVAYCFVGNEVNLMMPALNTFDLLSQFAETPQFSVQDSRVQQAPSAVTS